MDNNLNSNLNSDDKGFFRRKFPRRIMRRKVGLLCAGQYFVVESGEMGEGGMSIRSEYLLTDGNEIILSFQIPGGDFVSVRAVVRTTQKKDSENIVIHGVSFSNIQFAHKRQIRTFVSDRSSSRDVPEGRSN